jgi:ribonucleotide reductase alpha subunit
MNETLMKTIEKLKREISEQKLRNSKLEALALEQGISIEDEENGYFDILFLC